MESERLNGVVCFFNSCKSWGGGEKWHYEMARRLHLKGISVILCAYPGSPLYLKAVEAEIPVYSFRVNNFSFFNPVLRFKLKRFFRRMQVAHLFLNLPSDLKSAGPAARKAGVKNIIYRRGSAIPVSNSLSNRYLFRNVIDYMVVNSEETKRTVRSENPRLFDPDKIEVIYNGIDLQKYSPDAVFSDRTDEEIILGNAGRLERQKNQRFLIDLVALLHEKGHPVKLKIAGTGRLEKDLREHIRKLNLVSNVDLIGFTEEIQSFLKSTDFFVLSSLWEGFGYVIVEAQLCKKPVVAFDVSSNPEIISDGEDGYLVPKNDLEAFANAVIRLIENPSLRQKMGEKGFEKARNKFDIQTTTNNLIEFLRRIDA